MSFIACTYKNKLKTLLCVGWLLGCFCLGPVEVMGQSYMRTISLNADGGSVSFSIGIPINNALRQKGLSDNSSGITYRTKGGEPITFTIKIKSLESGLAEKEIYVKVDKSLSNIEPWESGALKITGQNTELGIDLGGSANDQDLRGTINLIFTQGRGGRQLGKERINVSINPMNSKLKACLGQKGNPRAQIACLEAISSGLSESEQQTRKQAIENANKSLEQDQRKALTRLKGTFKGSQKTLKLSCKHCNTGDFTLTTKGMKKSSKQKSWVLKASKEGVHSFTIKSKKFPGVSVSGKLNYEVSKGEEPIVENETIDQETLNQDDSDLIDQEIIENDTPGIAKVDPMDSASGTQTSELPVDQDKIPYVLGGILGLIVLILLARRKKSAPKQTIRQKETITSPKEVEEKPTRVVENIAAKEEISIASSTATTLQSEETADILFSEIAHEETDKVPLSELPQHEDYVQIDLTTCWENTAVDQIFLHQRAITELYDWVRQNNYYKGDLMEKEDVPEIGGFLLGHVYKTGVNSHQLTISYFVPITASQQNRYNVQFGDQAWVEVDEVMKAHPGYKMVGWFHTHPGHGLFLSEADLKAHTSTFLNPFQIAMEIDPLTVEYDTAFFTWKKDGSLNNDKDRKLHRWWSFRELEKQMSAKKLT